MTQLLFTTDPGLEDIVCDELRERLAAAELDAGVCQVQPFGRGGHVLATHPAGMDELWPIARDMRSVHHVLRFVHRFDLPPDQERPEPSLDAIAAGVLQVDIPEMHRAESFRVTANRSGTHPFTSQDVARVAGAALEHHYHCRVDLTGYDVNVRVDVFDETVIVGVQRTEKALSIRHTKVYHPRASLKANVAYALLRLARLRPRGAPLLDPFCGSGTILLEAGQIYPELELYGSDRYPPAVTGAWENALANGLGSRVHICQADARDLADVYPERFFQAIVTNPPFGLRVGRQTNFEYLYRRFLSGAWRVLRPRGRVVMLVHKRSIFNRLLDEQGGFRVRHVRVIETGDVYPLVFVLEKR